MVEAAKRYTADFRSATPTLSKNLLTHDDDGNVWRLLRMRIIAGGTILTTLWDFVFDEDRDPDDDLPPSGAIADKKTVTFAWRHWHEVVYYVYLHDDYPGGPYTHGVRTIVYEAVPTPQQTTPANRQEEGRAASI